MTIAVTGLGRVVLPAGSPETCDPRPYLKRRKHRKLMGPQDDLAVVAAAQAVASAGLDTRPRCERTGLFLVVGYLPFEEEFIDELVDASLDGDTFSMAAFSTTGLQSVNPLLSFRCLPNMPLFHICANLDLTGPYCIGYPGPAQLYLALEQACRTLVQGTLDRVLVGGLADQRNFLVRHHLRRLEEIGNGEHLAPLANAAGIMVLEREADATARSARILARLEALDLEYHHHDPLSAPLPPFSERFVTTGTISGTASGSSGLKLPADLGPASLPVALGLASEEGAATGIGHALSSRDGTVAGSRWSLEPRPVTTGKSCCLTEIVSRPARPGRDHRVVVTGMGVVSPLGSGVATLRDRLLAGRSGIGLITLFDAAGLATRIAGEADLPPGPLQLRDRKIVFALEAARQAMVAATACGTAPGTDGGGIEGGLSLGIGLELFSLEDMVAYRRGARPSHALADRLTFLQTPADICLHLLSDRYRLGQPPLAHVSACAAGADAIGTAMDLIASGRRRWMLAGGTDSMINPLGVGGFCLLGATSTRNERPQEASRPFDRGRDGFVLGEGAAILVLERLDDALARGATVHAELLGYGCAVDTYSISAPDPAGRGALLAMHRALASARLAPEDIDCVNAHGTSTPLNDRAETAALKSLLGERAYSVPVCANKSMLGHLISAAGAVEAVAAIACMAAGRLPPTINLDDPDPQCDLDYVTGVARDHDHHCLLSNSFGFGGVNACLVLGRGEHA